MDNNKNFLLFAVLSILIVLGFNYMHTRTQPPVPAGSAVQQTSPSPVPAPAPETLRDRSEVIKSSPRVSLRTTELAGSINLKGARFDDLTLTNFRETPDPKSPQVTLLSPSGSAAPNNAQFAEFSWFADSKDVVVPTSETEWKADGKALTPSQPLKLTWKSPQGLVFEREIVVDELYMFTLTDRVTNSGSSTVTLYPSGLVSRQGGHAAQSAVIHEGLIGVLDNKLDECTNDEMMGKSSGWFSMHTCTKHTDSNGGWLGITSKYWLTAMMPQQNEKITADVAFDGANVTDPNQGQFQVSFHGSPTSLAAGAKVESVTRFFAGAKKISLLDAYEKKFDIPRFDRAIDFGLYYFLTKPFLYMLSFLGTSLGSLGIAILVFTVMLKLVTLPLSLKSNHSMARMKTLQPEVKRLQERFADDKIRLNQEMMELFKREKVSPMSGCVPTLIQIPIFFALYKVLYIGIEMRQAPFYGWIHDMSAPDPTSVLTMFGAIPFALPAALHIGVWPILMGCSMFLQQRMSPQTMDKSQARMFMFMPVLFTYMLANMPAGLVIYWTWSNLLSILQQWYITTRDIKGKV